MKTFEFNKYGVCTNPEEITVYQSKGWDNASVKLAQAQDGKWCFGDHHHCGLGGGGSPCAPGPYNSFETRQGALIAALDYLIKQADKHKQTDAEGKAHKKFRQAIEKYKASLFQTTLFA